MKIEYEENKEEYLKTLRLRVKKEEKIDKTMQNFVVMVGIVTIILSLLFKPLIGVIVFVIGLVVVGVYSFSVDAIPLKRRESIITTISESEENGKLLKIVYNDADKRVKYTYDFNGKVCKDSFSVEREEIRTDIESDILYLGDEFVFYKKYKLFKNALKIALQKRCV